MILFILWFVLIYLVICAVCERLIAHIEYLSTQRNQTLLLDWPYGARLLLSWLGVWIISREYRRPPTIKKVTTLVIARKTLPSPPTQKENTTTHEPTQ